MVSCYDILTSKCFRDIKTASHPTKMSFLPQKNLLVVAESRYISLFDLRQHRFVERLYVPSNSIIYAMDCRPDVIAIGGESRTVTFFDAHTWNVRHSLKACTKYQITSIHFSREDPNKCYIADDSVLQCNTWKTTTTTTTNNNNNNKNTRKGDYFANGFKFDSRPLGISISPNLEVVMAMSENGTFYSILGWNTVTEDNEGPKKKARKSVEEISFVL
eukprot:TRINITY_DN7016_c0_g2_i3.p1 TRINITY_DN7016_c0_g2~~TRINITY_DN7016_c0_g2_i3.p1  ORF type:complete len:217 (+),score=50.44 TRINITY_DN7016_c0_g2_i3:636-1286(+)